jgi:hypothetical protein
MRTRSRRSDKNTFAFVAKAPGSLKRWRGMLSVANRRRPLRMRLCCDRVGRIAAEMARWQTAAFNCHRREARAAEDLVAKSRYGLLLIPSPSESNALSPVHRLGSSGANTPPPSCGRHRRCLGSGDREAARRERRADGVAEQTLFRQPLPTARRPPLAGTRDIASTVLRPDYGGAAA